MKGLSSEVAERLLRDVGPNALPIVRPPSFLRRFVRQFRSALVYLLLLALLFDLGTWLWHGAQSVPLEGIAIGVVLLLNAGLGALQEHRSEAALAKLELLAAPEAWVSRDGAFVRRPSRELVPGDIVRVEAGERLPADGVVLDSFGLLVDESIVTGESLPIEKAGDEYVLSGTLAVRGSACIHITQTGLSSSMGKLAVRIGGIDTEPTPLERRLGVLGQRVALWVGGLAVLLTVLGIAINGWERLDHAILFAVALAVAAVPEGMPAMVTLALALGVRRMAKNKVVVRRLSAVEALGSVTVIATDKTGTLTENRMVVQSIESDAPEQALRAMVLAGDADIAARAGDPLDTALLDHAERQGMDLDATLRANVRSTSRSFDSAWGFMRVTVESDEGVRSFVKGSPEIVIERCDLPSRERELWLTRAESAAARGFRVVALADGEGECEDGLRFLGIVSLWDPPRPGAREAIEGARDAGVRVLMITGDHSGTAATVAQAVGLDAGEVVTGAKLETQSEQELLATVAESTVFARVSPEQKLRLIEALRRGGDVVAMTGDGVNDAPALKRADVGIAMGRRGSDVAREVSDIVLMDDDLGSIVGAIEEGRNIYRNIQSFIRFTFSTNVALVIVVVVGAIAYYAQGVRDASGATFLPLTALQLLWINLLGDGPPALALALDRTPDVMRRPPRATDGSLLDPGSGWFILSTGLMKGLLGVGLLVVWPLLGATLLAVQTTVFLYESVAKLVSAYAARRWSSHPTTNVVLHICIGLGVALQIATSFVPGLRALLGLTSLSALQLVILSIGITATWAFAELMGYVLGPGKARKARS
ncbi:cation-translocating P-type ATPase [Paraliomyxa miuraensis]|uniref:cation-translocating P-type ATPase n=1 Tax=Paraliomyxa miuraensis TaxID=376150 RepID=UPI002250ED76|nr:cation-transporting P-type ATPase [Paraliomyxa miuraensis]MCX4239226.1 cation-transporting P-type ATPase [Paraliomyxa miuraensis]